MLPLLLFYLFALIPLFHGQEPPATRAEEIQREQLRKQTELKPETETRAEQIIEEINDKVIERVFASSAGFGLQFGGLPTGSGIAVGPRYFRPGLLGERLRFETSLVGSVKQYYAAQAMLAMPRIGGARFDARFLARRIDAPSLLYFGPGPDSQRWGRSNYRLESNSFDIRLGWRPDRRHWLVGYHGGALLLNVGPGQDSRMPLADAIYAASQAPGIDRQSNYLVGGPFVQFDHRDRPGDPHRGGLYSVRYLQYWDRTWNRFSFNRMEGEAQHYIPFLNEKRVIALRAKTALSYVRPTDAVPFYLQPNLGGSDELRGFQRFRFHDNNSVLFTGEYRWEVAPALEMAAFVDAGNVFPRPGLIGFRNTQTAGGLGFRFKSRDSVALRVDTGVSREGVQIWLKFGNMF